MHWFYGVRYADRFPLAALGHNDAQGNDFEAAPTAARHTWRADAGSNCTTVGIYYCGARGTTGGSSAPGTADGGGKAPRRRPWGQAINARRRPGHGRTRLQALIPGRAPRRSTSAMQRAVP